MKSKKNEILLQQISFFLLLIFFFSCKTEIPLATYCTKVPSDRTAFVDEMNMEHLPRPFLVKQMKLLEKGKDFCNMDAIDETFFASTALHQAVLLGDEAIVRDLLIAGASVHIKSNLGDTALHWAIKKQNVAITQLLISHQADVNATDQHQMTPLHWAIIRKQLAMAIVLLNAGADVHAKDYNQCTPIAYANDQDKKILLQWLEANHANDTKNGYDFLVCFFNALLGCFWKEH